MALARVNERSTSDHVDALRSIFRRYDAVGSYDTVNMLVDSQFIMRKLHDKIDGQELLNSYHKRRNVGITMPPEVTSKSLCTGTVLVSLARFWKLFLVVFGVMGRAQLALVS